MAEGPPRKPGQPAVPLAPSAPRAPARVPAPPAATGSVPRVPAPPAATGSMPRVPAPPAATGSMPRVPAPPAATGSMPRVPAPPAATGSMPRVPAPPPAPTEPGRGGTLTEALAKELAVRFGGALHSRRIFGDNNKNWGRTIEAVESSMAQVRQRSPGDLTIGLVEGGVVVSGVVLLATEPSLAKLRSALSERDIEVVAFRPGSQRLDLECAIRLLSTDVGDTGGAKAAGWLAAQGARSVVLRHVLVTEKKQGAPSFRDVFRTGAEVLGTVFTKASGGSLDVLALRDVARSLLDFVLTSELPVTTLLAMREKDAYNFVHATNVSVLAACQAQALGLAAEQVEEVSLCGLLHDVGKLKLPDAIVRKRGGLTPEQRAQLDRHTVLGARLLAGSRGLGATTTLVALEHHDGWAPDRPAHPWTQLVALADTYDRLQTLRPAAPGAAADAHFGWMATVTADRFDPRLLGRFGRLVGAFGTGAKARLPTGERVRIAQESVDDPLRPIVVVEETASGRLPPGLELDLRGGTARLDPDLPPAFAQLKVDELDALG